MCGARLEGQQSLMKEQHFNFTSLVRSGNMNAFSAILLFF